MKITHRIATLVVAAMLLAAPTFAQNATKPSPKESRQRVCHTMGNLDRLMQENAKMARHMALIEKQTETYMRRVQATLPNVLIGGDHSGCLSHPV